METKNYNYDFILPFFTAQDELRPAMSHPHKAGDGYVYATDAHLLIRIPEKKLAQEYTQVENYPTAPDLMNKTLAKDYDSCIFPVSDLVRVLSKAKWIKEYDRKDCPACDGEGECYHCGNGWLKGERIEFGLLQNEDRFKVKIKNNVYQADFLHIITITALAVGADTIEYSSSRMEWKPGIFKFADIVILLMPDLSEDTDEVIIVNA